MITPTHVASVLADVRSGLPRGFLAYPLRSLSRLLLNNLTYDQEAEKLGALAFSFSDVRAFFFFGLLVLYFSSYLLVFMLFFFLKKSLNFLK